MVVGVIGCIVVGVIGCNRVYSGCIVVGVYIVQHVDRSTPLYHRVRATKPRSGYIRLEPSDLTIHIQSYPILFNPIQFC